MRATAECGRICQSVGVPTVTLCEHGKRILGTPMEVEGSGDWLNDGRICQSVGVTTVTL